MYCRTVNHSVEMSTFFSLYTLSFCASLSSRVLSLPTKSLVSVLRTVGSCTPGGTIVFRVNSEQLFYMYFIFTLSFFLLLVLSLLLNAPGTGREGSVLPRARVQQTFAAKLFGLAEPANSPAIMTPERENS